MAAPFNRIAQANQDFGNHIVAELANIRQTTDQILTEIANFTQTQMQENITKLTQTQTQMQENITKLTQTQTQMQENITNFIQTQTQMQASINNVLQNQAQMQTNINNILQNQVRNQNVNLNRGDVCDLINKGIAKHNFEDFYIEQSKSYVWANANLPDLRFFQMKIFFKNLIDNCQNGRKQIRDPTRDEKREMNLYFKYLDIYWDTIKGFIRNHDNNYQAALNAANAATLVQ